MFNRQIALPLALPVLLLAGCVGLPADRGRDDVAVLVKERGRDASQPADDTSFKRLLADITSRPLAASDAVRLALVNNYELRAQYAELGIAAAEVYEAGRLSNPTLSASVLFPSEPDTGNETTFGLAQSFTDLLLIGPRSRLAQGEFERAKLSVAAVTLDLAADTESAYYRLIGAQQVARMRAVVAKAAKTSADLAQRFFDAGNVTKLELARERAAAAQARIDDLQAQTDVAAARAELGELLGLPASKWSVVERMAIPPDEEDPLGALVERADKARLDLAAARKQVAVLADALGVTRRFRYLGEVEIGVEQTRVTEGVRLTGPTLSLQLPIFNQGKGAVVRSEAQLQQAEADLQTLELGVVIGIQRAYAELENARSRIEQYRTALIPQREEIVQRTQEQVNFMLVGQFELLLSKQQEYDAYQGYLEAVRDYWVARTELRRQVGAPLPSSARIGESTLDVDTLIAPKEPAMPHDMKGMDHRGHDMKQQGGPQGEMDHSGHGAKPKAEEHKGHGGAAPSGKQPAQKKPPEKPATHPGHDMPTGMEPHIPEPSKKDRKPSDEEETETHQHGDHQ